MVTTDHHEKTPKNLRKGKVDIILMTIFLACFFEYSQWKIIDLPAAELKFVLCFSFFESRILISEGLSFPSNIIVGELPSYAIKALRNRWKYEQVAFGEISDWGEESFWVSSRDE